MYINERSNFFDEEKERENLNAFYIKTFKWMFLGLFITAITGMLTVYLVPVEFFSNLTILFFAITEVILVMIFSRKFNKVSSTTATVMYIVLTFINGIFFSSVFYSYNIAQIGMSFAYAAILFGAMSLYGYKTKKDLTKWGPWLIIALIICLISLVINLILNNTWIDILLSFAVIIVMSLVTAFDIHTMKYKKVRELDNSHIYFAFSIYLDFLNIFLYILRLFGINTNND